MKMNVRGAPHFAAAKPKTPMPRSPMIHPSAQTRTRVRLPDANNVGVDPAPIVPNAGKI